MYAVFRMLASLLLAAPAAALMSTPRPSSQRVLSTARHVATPDESVEAQRWELDRTYRQPAFRHPEKVEVMKDMEAYVDSQVDKHLLNIDDAWQPSDYVPDMTKESWVEDVTEFRKKSEGISDELMVVLIGDMVTEEALPTYQTLLNRFEGTEDLTGVSSNPWARWSRQWTSEENRHGDLLNRYLYLTGRCDMRSVEVTIQRLLARGFDTMARHDPYHGFIYTSFQERATKISHGKVGKLAMKAGDSNLAQICAKIAGDEARHEKAYQAFMEEVFERDPNGAILSFRDMMKSQISMPAMLMHDGQHAGAPTPGGETALFSHFADAAQRLGVYTALDYAEIMEYLVDHRFAVAKLQNLSPEALEAQDYLCRLPARYTKLAARAMKAHDGAAHTPVAFSWVQNRLV